MSLTDAVGILGFGLAVAVFVLTRLENRKAIQIELRSDYTGLFRDEREDWERGILLIRFVNTGRRVVLLDPDTVAVHAVEKSYSVRGDLGDDWFGVREPFAPLAPGQSCAVGLSLEGMEQVFDLDRSSIADVPIAASVGDATGRVFRSREHYAYIPEVGELERRKRSRLSWRRGRGRQ